MYNEEKKVKELMQTYFFTFISLLSLISFNQKSIELVELSLVNFLV